MNEPVVTSAGLSAGTLLRQAREAAGLHIGALSVSLKVPVKKIEALEADRLDQLPDAVFARALASSICRTIKVDPAPILEALPQGGRTVLRGDDGPMGDSFQPAGGAPLHSVRELVSKPFVMMGLALIAGALLLWFLPQRSPPVASADRVAGVALANLPVGAASGVAGTGTNLPLQNEIAPGSQAQLSAVASPSAAAGGVTNLAANAERPVQPGPVGVSPQLVPQSPVAASSSAIDLSQAGVIAFEAAGPSWVEVIDRGGVVLLRKTLETGERITATGQVPLKVIVGRADAIRVKVRGQDFSLTAVSRDNVARFEVKQ